MNWSTKKINEIHKYLSQNSTLNVNSFIREFKIDSLLEDSGSVTEFPYITNGELITLPFLRRPNVSFDYTKEEITLLTQLKSEPELLSQFIKITNQRGSRVPFELYQKQKEVISTYTSSRFNLLKHSRQVGVSHLLTLICLHYIIINYDKSVVFVCNSYKHSQDRFFDFLSQLPFYMSPGIKIKPHKIEFDNGCKITFCRDLKNHRSGIDFLIIDHAGFMDLKSVLGDVIPYLSSKQHTQCFIASTPNKNSEFNKLFETSKWNKIILNWDIVPDRDSYWVQQMTNLLGGFQFFLNEYHVDDSVSSTRDLIIDSLISGK